MLALPWADSYLRILLISSGIALFQTTSVLDAHTMDFLGEEHKSMYGSIRLWTAVSWGAGCICMGFITDNYGFEYNFILFGAMCVTTLFLVGFGLPSRSESEEKLYAESSRRGQLRNAAGPAGDDGDAEVLDVEMQVEKVEAKSLCLTG